EQQQYEALQKRLVDDNRAAIDAARADHQRVVLMVCGIDNGTDDAVRGARRNAANMLGVEEKYVAVIANNNQATGENGATSTNVVARETLRQTLAILDADHGSYDVIAHSN